MHVACFVKKLIVTLSKEIDKMIRTNKLLFLSTKTQMHVACFVKTLIVILSKMHVACFVKTLIVTLFKEIDKNK